MSTLTQPEHASAVALLDERLSPDPRHRESLLRRLWPFALFAAATAIYYFPILASPPDQMLDAPDIVDYLFSIHQYTRTHLLAGHLPLWNPYIYCGVPFAANPQAAVFYPPTWLGLVLPVIHADKWWIALHVFLAGSFMYLFVRRLARTRLAAALAGMVWMFGSYFPAHALVGHLTIVSTATWMPLVLCLYERLLSTGRRWIFWTGIALGVQFLAGGDQNCYYTVLMLAIFGLVRTAADRPNRPQSESVRSAPVRASSFKERLTASLRTTARYRRWAADLVLVGLVAVLTSAVQLFPTAEMAFQSDRSANSYEFSTTMSFPPPSAVGFLLPWQSKSLTLLAVAEGQEFNLNWEYACYVGVLTLILAALSFRERKSASLRAIKVLLLVGVILMLGGYLPTYRLLYSGLPGLKLFRIAGRAVVIVLFALAVMSAFGFDWLLAGPERGRGAAGRGRWQSVRWRAIAAAALLFLAAGIAGPTLAGLVRKPPAINTPATIVVNLAEPAVLKGVLFLLAAAVLLAALRWMSRPVATAAIALFVLANMLATRPEFLLRPCSPGQDDRVAAMTRLRHAAADDDQPFRMDLCRGQIEPNVGMAAGAENVNAYWPVALGRFYRYVHAMRHWRPDAQFRHQLHDELYWAGPAFPVPLLNVKTASKGSISIANPPAFDPNETAAGAGPKAKERPKFRGAAISARYEVLTAPSREFLPRAWVVARAEAVGGEDQALARLLSPDFDPAATVLLEHAVPTPAGKSPVRTDQSAGIGPSLTLGGTARVAKWSEDRLEIETQSAGDGYLVLSEIGYPGWKATLDGRPVKPERADYVLAAVPLPPGSHRVSYFYDPLSFKLGAVCTALAALAAAGMLVASGIARFRRQPIPS